MGRPPPARRGGGARFRTPHSGYHFAGQRRSWFEGWYFRVTLPEERKSFAFMYSIEDPAGGSARSGMGVQVMGPRMEEGCKGGEEGYLCHYTRNVHRFWGDERALELGACLERDAREPALEVPRSMLSAEDFERRVARGFQASESLHQGRVVANGAGVGGSIPQSVTECSWSYTTEPLAGWGSTTAPPQPTAGWLAALPVFEPHWQVLMAHGRSSGRIDWGGRTYEFQDAPSYAEKNWGAGFPRRWFWVQCNAFEEGDLRPEGTADISVTATGATRQLPGPLGEEDVALIGVHIRGAFVELSPMTDATLTWDVDPWGRWSMEGENGDYRAVLEATCASPGTPLRAPTPEGLVPVCNDTFEGEIRLQVWKRGAKIADARSTNAGLEVGGALWGAGSPWVGESRMKQPLKSVVGLPINPSSRLVPARLRPNGL